MLCVILSLPQLMDSEHMMPLPPTSSLRAHITHVWRLGAVGPSVFVPSLSLSDVDSDLTNAAV